jgi:hypothetical protein
VDHRRAFRSSADAPPAPTRSVVEARVGAEPLRVLETVALHASAVGRLRTRKEAPNAGKSIYLIAARRRCGVLLVFVPPARGTSPPMYEKLLYRVVGSPPAPGASREARLRWVRRFYRFSLIAVALVAIVVLVAIVAVVTTSTFLWIAAAAIALWWAVGLASISRSIGRCAAHRE